MDKQKKLVAVLRIKTNFMAQQQYKHLDVVLKRSCQQITIKIVKLVSLKDYHHPNNIFTDNSRCKILRNYHIW